MFIITINDDEDRITTPFAYYWPHVHVIIIMEIYKLLLVFYIIFISCLDEWFSHSSLVRWKSLYTRNIFITHIQMIFAPGEPTCPSVHVVFLRLMWRLLGLNFRQSTALSSHSGLADDVCQSRVTKIFTGR
jgi:hypothetical protein